MESSLVSTLKLLKQPNPSRRFDKIIVGVLTNTDDRVPSVLSSFGLNVSPLRYGTEVSRSALVNRDYDIDFHCMSYDVGVEKPDKLIFEAAELMLTQIISAQDGKSLADARADVRTWRKVYVGDEYDKDVVGAKDAGWDPVLFDPEKEFSEIPRLGDFPAQTLDEFFRVHAIGRARSIQDLVEWIISKR